MKEDFEQLLRLADERDRLHDAWYRHLLTLAAGGLAILAGLDPEPPDSSAARTLLAATWVFLGSGILCGAAATFQTADVQARLVSAFSSQLPTLRHRRDGGALPLPVSATPRPIYRLARRGMVGSLLLAVLSFVAFAVLRTLS